MLNGQLTVAAKIGESEYGTLQEAVNAAKSGDTIVLTQDCDEKISVSGKSVTIDLDGHTYDKDKITLGSRCSMSVSDDKITITYSAPSGGGSSSSSSGDYTVSVENSKHGTVTVSPKRADKGDTVTITVKPDNGYELDELTVTDKDGQRISYTSIRGNNVLSIRVGRFTASLRASLATLRQLRAEGIDTITFQTILRSTTLSVDELLAMGGEDAEVVLTHHIRSSTLTVGGKAV